MARRSGVFADLWSVAVFAPLVVAARAQLMAMEAIHPTRKGRREILRMMHEKPLALSEAAFAAQKALLSASAKQSADLAKAATAFSLSASADALQAATASTRRRVRRNARRLTGF